MRKKILEIMVLRGWVISFCLVGHDKSLGGTFAWCNEDGLYSSQKKLKILERAVTHPEFFLGKNGTYIKPTKAPPWLALSKIFVLSDALKMYSPSLPVLRFICETFSKLLKFALRNTSVRGWFFKKSYFNLVLKLKICMAVNLWELRSDLRRSRY